MALHRITTLTVGVTDVEATSAWYRDFGLDEVAPGELATRDGGVQLALEPAAYRGLRRIGIGCDDPDDLERITRSIEATDMGVDVTREGNAISFLDPVDRVPYEISVAARYATATTTAPGVNTASATVREDRPADGVLRAAPVAPSNLTHFVRGTVDHEASIRFHLDALGFEMSDPLPGIGGFLRCSDLHHNLALQSAPAPFLHHMSFECDDVDEVGRGATHMLERDPDCHVWGLGRHAIGSNFFWYLRDPAGNYAEYSSDIDRISSQDAYRPKEWSGHEGLYSWGPPLPVEFIAPPDIEEVIAAMVEG